MKKQYLFWFIAVVCILASCTKDEISDQPLVAEKAGHVKGPVIYLTPQGGDDTQMFIDAFAASAPGTTILMSAGVFHTNYLEVHGFRGTLKGAGKDRTIIAPAGLFEVNPFITANCLPAWWKIIGGDVTLSDFSFRTGDGPLISDVDPIYNKVMSCILVANNYNAVYNADDYAPMNFNMRNVDFICGYLDPALAYLGEPYNVLMPVWVGTDVYWPMEDIILTSGTYNINNCNVKNSFQGFEGFSLGEDAVFTIAGCKIFDCDYGIFTGGCYNSRINIINNTINNSKYFGVYVTDSDFSLLSYVMPFKRCEYNITGNIFNPLPGSLALLMKDEWGVVHPDKYFPSLVTAKNNLFNLTEGSTGVTCANSADAVVRNNRFTGTGAMGVYIDGAEVYDAWTGENLGTGDARNVLVLGNNFAGLDPTTADIYLGERSSYCTVVGDSQDMVVDLGDFNKITGMKQMRGGNHLGPTIRDNFRMMPRHGHQSH